MTNPYDPADPQNHAEQVVTPPGNPPQVTSPKNSKLGLIALITAIVGFIFGVVPGAMIVGWILLPIAFILSLVALFQPGKKTQAIIGLVLSIVGTIASVIAFTLVVGKAVDDAFSDLDQEPVEVVEIEEVEDAATPAESNEAGSQDSAALGSRKNPFSVGEEITSGEWTVVVNSVTPDATAEVMDANPYNDPPEEGQQYLLFNLTSTYTGADKGHNLDIAVAFVADSGEVYNTYDTMVAAPDPAFGFDELYEGASATGNEVISVPAGATGLIRVTPGMFADEYFVNFE